MAQTENFYDDESAAAKFDDVLSDFTSSFAFDRRLFAADARVSLGWNDALFHAGVLNRHESERLKNGLQSIVKRAGYDRNYFHDLPAEDVYSFADARLIQLVGETGRKLQIGRSRADRSATVLRLWLREEIEKISDFARFFQLALIDAAERQPAAVLPTYAHRRRAQPILWAHWCLAYFEMLARDRERLDETWRRVNILPLGAGAAAGTNFEIDREQLARDLGFEGVSLNSLDAVFDRDFAVELLAACALLATHLSRFAADLTLCASEEFQFVEFARETISSGSNEAKHDKNIRALELICGKAGRIFGHQTALLTTLKNLPALLSGDDLHEDKRAIFDTVDGVKNSLRAAAAVLGNVRVGEETARAAATENSRSNAQELNDYLTQKDVPVRAAQQSVEKILHHAVANFKNFSQLTLAEMRNFSAHIEADVFDRLSLEQTLASKSQIGGTAPERVFEALSAARAALEMEK